MAVEARQEDIGAAREHLYELHGAVIWSFALRVCVDPGLAREVVSEALEAPLGGVEDATCPLLATASRVAGLLAPEPAAAGRGVLGMASLQERVRDCNARLPTRQREVLALRALAGLSYDEMAAVMDLNRAGVAQLIARARLALAEELRGTPVIERSTARPECARAMPMMASLIDGQLQEPAERAWLDRHLDGCERCVQTRQALNEADLSYRAWLPAPVPMSLWADPRLERPYRVTPLAPPARRVRAGRWRRRVLSLCVLIAVLSALGAFAVTLFEKHHVVDASEPARPAEAGAPLPTPEPIEVQGTDPEPDFPKPSTGRISERTRERRQVDLARLDRKIAEREQILTSLLEQSRTVHRELRQESAVAPAPATRHRKPQKAKLVPQPVLEVPEAPPAATPAPAASPAPSPSPAAGVTPAPSSSPPTGGADAG
jgi:DNA-directed RNA polymerase specialized sigma24 family protein